MENNDEHEEWDSGCNTASCYAKEVKDGYLITTEGGEEVATMKRSKKNSHIWHLRDIPHNRLIDWDRYQNDLRDRHNIKTLHSA